MSITNFYFVIQFMLLLCCLSVLQLVADKNANIKKVCVSLQLILLLLYSYVFMFLNSWSCLLCLFGYSCIIYVIAIWMEKSDQKTRCAFIGIVVSVVFLAYFKYANFFVQEYGLWSGNKIEFSVMMPLGISFYVFTGIAYLVDVCRGECKTEKNPLNFFLFISFFPKIAAGPIVLGQDFLKQVKNYQGIIWKNVKEGVQIFVFGFYKKMVLADRLAVFVDDVFFAPSAYSASTVVLASVSYSLQIYYDFSGYSDMAIGLAKMMGFNFQRNFNLPYVADSISDFWKRWHISLSQWLQRYIYIPLGGSRRGVYRTYLNLMIVMLISGLWHGTGLTFLIWGGMYGLLSCIEKMGSKRKVSDNLVRMLIRRLVVFIIVTCLWVFFRADTLQNAVEVFYAMRWGHEGIVQPYTWTFFALVVLTVATIMAENKKKREGGKYIDGYYPILDLSKFRSLVVFLVFCGVTIYMSYFGNTVFIYGAF